MLITARDSAAGPRHCELTCFNSMSQCWGISNISPLLPIFWQPKNHCRLLAASNSAHERIEGLQQLIIV